jgi:hypothetical protein
VSDARLTRWLELTREFVALGAVEQLDRLQGLCDERAALMRELAARPPASPTPLELSRALEDSEAAFNRALAELRADLGQRIDALRGARQAANGYRPAALGHPAFVSRSV